MNYDINVEIVLRDNFDISAENIDEASAIAINKCREKYGYDFLTAKVTKIDPYIKACPHKYKWGTPDEHPECETCKIWEKCVHDS